MDNSSIISDLTSVDSVEEFSECAVEVEEPYCKDRLPARQVETGALIYNYFVSVFRWILLFAQMQSGKTETYMFVAAEMIRTGKVQHVVIFSGNREKELRAQIPENFEAFCTKYQAYLAENNLGNSESDRIQIMNKLKKNFEKGNKGKDSTVRIVWGTELKKYNGPKTDTLFIWEESHYGQSLDQEVDAFLRTVGISADGNVDILREKHNYFLSVSATPFSEMSDLKHDNQTKKLVIMKPVSCYNSVEKMWNQGRIHSYTGLEEGLTRALTSVTASKKFAVIRSSLTNEKNIVALVRQAGWKIAYYNSKQMCKIDGKEYDSLDFMSTAPSKNTCIILKGMCRMGKQLKKDHLSFVFETALTSSDDTELQGLLGRACGYGNSMNVQVYLPANFCESGCIQRYISLANDDEIKIMPKKAMNLKGCRNTLDAIIPVRLDMPREDLESVSREHLIESVKAAFNEEDIAVRVYQVTDNNTANNQAKIRERILGLDDSCFKLHNLEKQTYVKQDVLRKIRDSNDSRRQVMLGSSCGVKANGEEVKMWVCKADGCVYVDCRIDGYCSCSLSRDACKCFEFNTRNIPKTTGREVFKHKLVECDAGILYRQNAFCQKQSFEPVGAENDISTQIRSMPATSSSTVENASSKASTVVKTNVVKSSTTVDDCNGMFEIYIDPSTMNSVSNMLTALDDLVKISKIIEQNPMLVGSKYLHHNIKVSEEVYQALLKGGAIHQAIQTKHSMQLKIKVDPKKSSIGVIHLKAIYW